MTQLKNQSKLVTGFIEELTRINKYYNCFSINISYTFYWTESPVRNSTFPVFYTTSQGEIKTLFLDICCKWLTIRGGTAKILYGEWKTSFKYFVKLTFHMKVDIKYLIAVQVIQR